MALFQSKQVASKLPLTESDGAGDAVEYLGEFITTSALANGDVIELVGVPAYHVPVNVQLLTDQVDSNGSPTMTVDWGYISGTFGDGTPAVARTCGTEFASASTTPIRAAGYISTAATNTALGRSVATTAARGIGIKVAAAIATLVVGARIRCRVVYVSDPGDLT
jgi:hypothetical protein